MYADVEGLLIGWLQTKFLVRCVTDTPANLADVLPVIRVTRFGGEDAVPTIDHCDVDIDVFAANRAGAVVLAERVRSALRFELPGRTVVSSYVASVETISAPSWRPYENTRVRRFGATYSLIIQSRFEGDTP